MKFFKAILLQLMFCTTSIVAQIDTAYIKLLVGKNVFFQNRSLENFNFKIISSYKANYDTLFVKFETQTNTDWDKKNMPEKANFMGLIIRNEKSILHGSFSYTTLNRNEIPVTSMGNYVNDKLEGMLRVKKNSYYISQTFYKNGMKNGIDIMYWGDEKEIINQFLFYVNDTLNGSFNSFYQNGALQLKGNYKMGNKNGNFTSYYDNNKVKYEKIYFNGVLKDKMIEYYETGKIKSIGEYSGNFLNVKVECDTCKPINFIYRNQQCKIVNIDKTYSIEFKKELGGIMRDWSYKSNNIFSLKKGIWLYYNEDGTVQKKMKYDSIGNAFVFP